MIRSTAEFHAGEPQSVSMRGWMYLGAVTLGLALAALQDPGAADGRASEKPLPADTAESHIEPANALTTKTANTGKSGESRLKNVSAELALRPIARAP